MFILELIVYIISFGQARAFQKSSVQLRKHNTSIQKLSLLSFYEKPTNLRRIDNPTYSRLVSFHKSHIRSQPVSLIDKSGGIAYRTSVFTPEEFCIIQNEVNSLYVTKLQEETSSSVAQHRLGVVLPPKSKTSQLLRDPKNSLTQLLQKLTATGSDEESFTEYELSQNIPIEIRSYERVGSCMAWHTDDVLYEPIPQIEVVWTLENTSDCQTLWKTPTGDVRSIETDPNAALFIRAGEDNGAMHCVTSLKRGKRIILKCAFSAKNSKYMECTHRHQFGPSSAKKKNNKGSNRGRKVRNRKR